MDNAFNELEFVRETLQMLIKAGAKSDEKLGMDVDLHCRLSFVNRMYNFVLGWQKGFDELKTRLDHAVADAEQYAYVSESEKAELRAEVKRLKDDKDLMTGQLLAAREGYQGVKAEVMRLKDRPKGDIEIGFEIAKQEIERLREENSHLMAQKAISQDEAERIEHDHEAEVKNALRNQQYTCEEHKDEVLKGKKCCWCSLKELHAVVSLKIEGAISQVERAMVESDLRTAHYNEVLKENDNLRSEIKRLREKHD